MSNRKQRLRRSHEAQQNQPKQESRVFKGIKIGIKEALAIILSDNPQDIRVYRENNFDKAQLMIDGDYEKGFRYAILDKTTRKVKRILDFKK